MISDLWSQFFSMFWSVRFIDWSEWLIFKNNPVTSKLFHGFNVFFFSRMTKFPPSLAFYSWRLCLGGCWMTCVTYPSSWWDLRPPQHFITDNHVSWMIHESTGSYGRHVCLWISNKKVHLITKKCFNVFEKTENYIFHLINWRY